MEDKLPARWLRTVAEVGIRAAGPKQVVETLIKTLADAPWRLRRGAYDVVGLGKAAAAQVGTWLEKAPSPAEHRAFVPLGYERHAGVQAIAGNHPIPGPESFRAGRALREWLTRRTEARPLVVLMSGGASAAVEDPAPGWSPAEISAASERLLASGDDIAVINAIRSQWSSLKAGGALKLVGSRPLLLAVQADVPPGQEAWVGSGPFDPGPFPVPAGARDRFAQLFPGRPWREPGAEIDRTTWRGVRVLVGSNAMVLKTIAHVVRREGLTCELYPEALSGDVDKVAAFVVRSAQQSAADVLVFGGEPTVRLGAGAGRGGRLGRLVLRYALAAWERPAYPMIAVASDGVDGTSAGAGALWLPGPFDREAALAALEAYASDAFFARSGRLVTLPNTGANVRDLAIVLRRPDKLRA